MHLTFARHFDKIAGHARKQREKISGCQLSPVAVRLISCTEYCSNKYPTKKRRTHIRARHTVKVIEFCDELLVTVLTECVPLGGGAHRSWPASIKTNVEGNTTATNYQYNQHYAWKNKYA
jgi:hypothetical protein